MMIDGHKAYLAYDPESTGYPDDAPYHPDVRYPEYPFSELASAENGAYQMIRNVLHQMGLDHARFGTPAWNPLGDVIKPGSKVILKPNFVSHINYGYRDGITDTDCLVTHGSIVRAIADYVAIALKGKGTIVLGDSPIQPTDWQEMMRVSGVDRLGAFYASKGITFRTEDFRLVQAFERESGIVPGPLDLARYKVAFVADDRLIVHAGRIDHELVPTQGAPIARASP